MKIMALDIGLARTGVAVTDPFGSFAQPLSVLKGNLGPLLAKDIALLAKEQQVSRIIVGLPLSGDGETTAQAEKIKRFILVIEGALRNARLKNIVIETIDESMTTKDAHQKLKEAGIKYSARKAEIDKFAAALILESWLEGQKQNSQSGKGGA